jgi:deferrochelatase/peroxidase EfeB
MLEGFQRPNTLGPGRTSVRNLLGFKDGGGRDAVDTGLLFISFQQDLERGFVSVQRRLAGEPLEEFIQPVGGGFFFVPPGVAAPGGYLGEGMIAAAGA